MNIKKKRRIKSTFLILFTILAVQFASIRESYALSAYFIQSLIDDQNANFTVDVVFDNPGKKFGLPFGRDSLAKQIERELGNFRDLKNK